MPQSLAATRKAGESPGDKELAFYRKVIPNRSVLESALIGELEFGMI